jgi:hypothetical protein
MKRHASILSQLMAACLLLALSSCSKEELLAPTSDEHGIGKVRVTTVPMDDTQQDSSKPAPSAGDTSISDDGDDVGDGERNRKKKPSN